MATSKRVIWSDGLFLRPQHFQQSERFLERWIEDRSRPLRAHAWGFARLSLDPLALSQGRISLATANGLLPDGTPFSIPDEQPAPPAVEIPANRRDVLIYLALPLRRAGMPEFTLNPASGNGAQRYGSEDQEVADSVMETQGMAAVKLGTPNLRLGVEGDPDDGLIKLGIARVVERRSSGELVLDPNYVPPVLDCQADSTLSQWLREVVSLTNHRATNLAERLSQPGQRGVAEITDFLLLQILNRATPVLTQLEQNPYLHPAALHDFLLGLAGELATHTHGDRRPAAFLAYRHDALHDTFRPLIQDLRNSLTAVLAQNVESIPLEDRGRGVHTAMLEDLDVIRNARFVLAATASVPVEQMRSLFPHQVKIGPSDMIRDLVLSQLPGIMLGLMPVAPRQLPYHAGFCYFELDRTSDFWKRLETNRMLALHVAGDFPGLQLELWSIRN